MFGVALDERHDSDYEEEQNGAKIIVDKELLDIYKGFEIDFTESWFSKGFFVRPAAGMVSSC